MYEIFLASFISSIIILGGGYFFSVIFFNKGFTYSTIGSEIGIYGIIFLSFLCVFLNFFFKIDKNVGSAVLILCVVSFIFFKAYKNYKMIILTSLCTFILILYSNVYRPDAGLYHLPVTSIINENRIIIGASNIHFRFAHSSIVQYFSALYNTHFFNINFITIPIASIFSFYIYYVFENYLKFVKEKNNFLSLFFFLLIIFSLYSFNRYSNFGNDAVAHIFYFILVTKLLTINFFVNIKKNQFYAISLICLFLLSNKIFMSIVVVIPALIYICSNKKIEILASKNFIYCLVFLTLWILKSVLTSGCIFYPISQTCFKNLKIYDHDKTKFEALSGEAWSKDWVNQKDPKLEFKKYNENFNWVDTWLKNHFKKVLEKLIPYIVFLVILIIYLFFQKRLKVILNNEDKKKYLFILFLSLIFSIIWFLKFPIYRYGFSFISVSLILIFCLTFHKRVKFIENSKTKQIFNSIIIISLIGFALKNTHRINKKINLNQKIYWPDIYSEKGDFIRKNFKPILYQNKILYYYSDGELCMYSKSPCSNYNIKNLKKESKFGYNIYWIN